MAKLTKKQKSLPVKIDSTKLYPLVDALGIVKRFRAFLRTHFRLDAL